MRLLLIPVLLGLGLSPIATSSVSTVQAPEGRAFELVQAAIRPAGRVDLKSRAALIVRADTGEVLHARRATEQLPIASITKLMTAMVVLDAGLPLDEKLTITTDDLDRLRNTASRLKVGSKLTRREALLLALMASENRAASALARTYPGGTAAAVAAMNRRAVQLGMMETRFADGSGLNGKNRASSYDLVRLVRAAGTYPEIRELSTKTATTVNIGRGTLRYVNTNPLVKNAGWDIALTKTGYLSEAGRCLVMQADIAGVPVIMVLMDSQGKLTRVGDANRVRKWLESDRRWRAQPPSIALAEGA